RQARTPALQHLALLDEKRPEIPSGLTVTHDPEGYPCIISGFLDARGRDIRGAALRMFRSGQLRQSLPFDDPQGTALPGGGLMAGRVVATPRADGPNSVSDCCLEVGPHPQRVLTLPWRPSGDLLAIRVTDRDGKQVDSRFSRASGGSALCFSPPLPAQSRVTVFVRTAEEVEIAATSSAAWPPAGASGVWRGRLARQQAAFLQSSPPAHVRQAG